jgi:hypothetical protein
VPGLLGQEHLGAGCGVPIPALYANGMPLSPNPAYSVHAQVAPAGLVVFAFTAQATSTPLGRGCTLFLDTRQFLGSHLTQANAAGIATWPLPVPAGLSPTDIACQAFELAIGGPIEGLLNASNGLRLRAAATGCP